MQKDSKKGFTLVELIIVIAILAVVVAILVPSIFGYIDSSRAQVCLANRSTIERSFTYIRTLFPEAKLEQVISGEYDKYISESTEGCPSGGTYSASADGQRVVCSIHGDTDGNGDNGGDGGNETDEGVYPGTDIPLDKNFTWPDVVPSPYQISPSGIYKFGDDYYINTTTAERWGASSPADFGVEVAVKISGNAGTYTQGMRLERGNIVLYNGDYYVYKSGPGEVWTAPSQGAYVWYKIPV